MVDESQDRRVLSFCVLTSLIDRSLRIRKDKQTVVDESHLFNLYHDIPNA